MVSLAQVYSRMRHQSTVDANTFKQAMRQLAGGVTVITAACGEEISGMTVTSFSSLTVDPPSVIVGISRSASSWPLIQGSGRFGANVLAGDQFEIAKRFTSQSGLKGPERFQGFPWKPAKSGTPLLVNALATFDCRVARVIDHHTHMVVIGDVIDLDVFPGRSGGLVYWSGQYHTVNGNEDMRILSEVSMPTARALREF